MAFSVILLLWTWLKIIIKSKMWFCLLSHSFLCWVIILIWIYFSMVSLFLSLSQSVLSHTHSVCFSLTLYLYLPLPLSSSLSLSLYLSSVLHCCPSRIQLIFYYLFILFCWLYLILPSIIIFILLSACLWACCCCLSVSDRLSSYLCCQRHWGNLNRKNLILCRK